MARLLVLRNGLVLARPQSDPSGPIPSAEDVADHLSIITKVEHVRDLTIVTSSTGDVPGYRWVKPTVLQAELPSDESDEVGEALLCA